MKLIELYAEEFGCFTERRFAFGEGMNLIEGGNESGKSTLQALLRFLFYGFPRRGGVDGEERYKRLSHKTHRAAGSVTFAWREAVYTVHRDYILHNAGGREAASEKLSVVCDTTHSTVELESKTPGEYFLSLPLALYHSSVCVRQSEIDGVVSPTTGDTIGDFLFCGEGGVQLPIAEKILDDARRELQHNRGRGGRIAALEEKNAALGEALAEAREHAERLRILRNDKSRYSILLQDKSKELTQTERMLRATELDRHLARYDAWHRAKEEESRLLAVWQALEARESEPLPSPETLEAANALLYRHAATEASVSLCKGEVERTERVAKSLSTDTVSAYIEENGGADRIAHASRRFTVKKRLGVAMLALFAVVAAVLLPLILVRESRLPQLWWAFAATCLLFFLTFVWRCAVSLRERGFYRQLQLKSPSMLRTFLVQYAREETARAEVRAERAQAASLLHTAAAQEKEAFEALCGALAAMGLPACHTHVEAQQQLYTLRERVIARQSTYAEERFRYETARSRAEALASGLDPQEETALRAARADLPQPTADATELERRAAFLRETVRGLTEKLTAAEREEITVMAVATDPAVLLAEKVEVAGELTVAKQRLAAIKMASAALEQANETLRGGVMPALAENASAVFEKLTQGRYTALCLSDDFTVSVCTPQGDFPLSHFSAGCRDAAHLSLRLGLTALITKEPLPLLLDEVTARLDDLRAAYLLSHLTAFCREGGQCLLFTCHTREAAMLTDAEYTHICL